MSIDEAKAVINDFLRAGKDCGRTKEEIKEALTVASESMDHLKKILWSYIGTRMFDGRKDT